MNGGLAVGLWTPNEFRYISAVVEEALDKEERSASANLVVGGNLGERGEEASRLTERYTRVPPLSLAFFGLMQCEMCGRIS